MNKLKNLYQQLIEYEKHNVYGWHNNYRNFYTKVKEIGENIKKGKKLKKDEDKDFFWKLLGKKDKKYYLKTYPQKHFCHFCFSPSSKKYLPLR